jgi:hypothetical protein
MQHNVEDHYMIHLDEYEDLRKSLTDCLEIMRRLTQILYQVIAKNLNFITIVYFPKDFMLFF